MDRNMERWDRDDKQAKVRDPMVVVIRWFQSRTPRERLILGGLGAFVVSPQSAHPCAPAAGARPFAAISGSGAPAPQFLMILWRTVEDHDTLFVLAETAHFLGIGVLVYKLHTRKSVSGERSTGPAGRAAASSTGTARNRTASVGRRSVAAEPGAHGPLPGDQALLQVGVPPLGAGSVRPAAAAPPVLS
jgi:hypothetical protein